MADASSSAAASSTAPAEAVPQLAAAPQAGQDALAMELGPWLAALGASDFEAAFREQGATSVVDVVRSGVTEDHLRELGMKLFVRARVATAILELRARMQASAEGMTPLQTADQRVEVARFGLLKAQQHLAAAEAALHQARRLTIHIVGFGTFGQFLAASFVEAGHTVVASSRSDYSALAKSLGVLYCRSAEEALRDYTPDVVLLATSIMSTATVVKHLPLDLLVGKLVVDVSPPLRPSQAGAQIA
jgi:predicted DCC family thiol-disulfide oxidoreductase YuxK